MLPPRGSQARTRPLPAVPLGGARRLLPQLLVRGDESAGDVRLAFDQFDQPQTSLSAEHEETVAIDALELPCPGPLIVCEGEPLVLLRQADPVDPGHDVVPVRRLMTSCFPEGGGKGAATVQRCAVSTDQQLPGAEQPE